jgi:hypothetical protein
MKSYPDIGKSHLLLRKGAALAVWAITVGLSAIQPAQAGTNVVLWDTGSRLDDIADATDRAGWKLVPPELFAFETNPAKAASDPGYYGRDYSFKGDVVVENQSLVAVFWSAKGRVVLYSKAHGSPSSEASSFQPGFGRKILEVTPQPAQDAVARISLCEILRNVSDEVALKVSFSAKASVENSVTFSFGRTEIVELKPGAEMKEVRLLSTIAYGIVPSFIGDDLIFAPAAYASTDMLRVPSENLFIGLLRGEESMMVMTWPKGNQQLKLRLSQDQGNRRLVEAIDFVNDGQAFYVAALTAPGIWHQEELKPEHLEKDVASEWRRPFPAKWKTQLSEAGVKTTFAFRPAKGEMWRGVPGSYSYPVWFVGDAAYYHLSKKVPPGRESIIYFVEGQDTPLSVPTPVEILQATLGRPASEEILDPASRKLRTHHRRGGDGVHRACTCGCTDAIQAVFEAGQEVDRKTEIKEALGDMIYFVERHVERIGEYKRFAEETIAFLRQQGTSSPELKRYLSSLESLAQQILKEQSVQKENMKSPEHVSLLSRQTMALTGSKDPNNLKTYMDLLKAWRAMGGAQDYVVAQCHTLTRELDQNAGYGCVDEAKAVKVAQEIRRRCRQCLKNPDGYEIWANY